MFIYAHRKEQSSVEIVLTSEATEEELWFNPSQQPSTRQPLTYSPPGGMGERIGRVKVRKLRG